MSKNIIILSSISLKLHIELRLLGGGKMIVYDSGYDRMGLLKGYWHR